MPKLKRSVLFYYSLADMPVMMSIFPALVFIPQFYASEMGVSLIAVANITLAVRIFDFLTDPLMGQISDRVRTPWGRRRPWLVCATPLMMVGIYMLYMPPADTQVGTGYMLVWMLVISLGTTMMLIPYYAWGAELSPDYNERTRITGARAISGQSGQMLAQFAPTVALLAFGIGGNRAVLAIVGVTMLCLMPICVWLTVSRAPDGPVEESAALPVLQGFRLMFRNGPFLWLALVFLISTCGLAMTTPLYLFFVADVLGDRERAIYVLFFFYLTSILAVPFWVWLSRHIGKHRGYMAALLMIAVSHPFLPLAGRGRPLVDAADHADYRLCLRRLLHVIALCHEGGCDRSRHPAQRRESRRVLLLGLVLAAKRVGCARRLVRVVRTGPGRLSGGTRRNQYR